jgi:uncharacterized protein
MNTTPKKMLPLYAKVSSALAREAVYAGALPISRLPRLAEALADNTGEMAVDLHLARDARRAPKLEGEISGTLNLQCQRCLRVFAWPLACPVDLRLVFNEEEETRVMKEAEAYLVADDNLPLHAIVEEEVLLALPLAPRCERDDCSPH